MTLARCRVCGATAPSTPDGILEGVAHAQAMENDPEHVRFLTLRAMPAADSARVAAITSTDPASAVDGPSDGVGSAPNSATPASGTTGVVKEAATPVYRDPHYTVLEKLVIPAIDAMLSGRAWNECPPECTPEQHFWACRFAPTASNEADREHKLRGERGFSSWR
jgi:hypothetical protein